MLGPLQRPRQLPARRQRLEWQARLGDHSFHPDWSPLVESATMRQHLLFGFPPPGHPYWTPQTIKDLKVRYPGLNTLPWLLQAGQQTAADA
jgi:hypothetical protein